VSAAAPRDPNPDSALEAVSRAVAYVAATFRGTLRAIRVQSGETCIEVQWSQAPTLLEAGSGTMSAEVDGTDGPRADLHYVCSPMVGTFYRASEPGGKPFIEVDDAVEPGQQVGIVEAMKLMNRIDADRAGRVVEVLVSNGTPVEYGDLLVALAPFERS
jgi:acetyl-CoA carboxylase biotin carboxyl carrier protein